MKSYECTLPVEQWRQILVNISPVDLCNVVLISRYMNSVASLPELWTSMNVSRRKVQQNGLAQFYSINRFKKVKQINFKRWSLERTEWDRLLKDIPGSPLENANLNFNDLSEVSADLLASAVAHLQTALMVNTCLTTDQCVALLTASISSKTLASLHLKNVDLSQVPADLLANSISRLQGINLFGTEIETYQCVSLLKASVASKTLKNISLAEIDLSEVPADLLANSISRLHNVDLSGTGIKTDQCVALLKAIISSETLKHVNLVNINLRKVPTDLLAGSISRLEGVNLFGTRLKTGQCIALLTAIRSSTTFTKVLGLGYVKLCQVPVSLLASSISQLQDVNLYWTRLTSDQSVAILTAVQSSKTLRQIDLRRNQVSKKIPTDQHHLLQALPEYVNL